MSKQPGPLRKLWFQWRMLNLPWRKRYLAGFDLEGNTFWEYKDDMRSGRKRRMIQYAQHTHHGDVQVPPHWAQWLRHTRREAPTIEEQQADVARQEQMKYLAAQADARWAAKASALDAPDKQQPVQMLESRDPSSGIRQMNADQEARETAQGAVGTVENVQELDEQDSGDAPTLKKQRVMKKEPKDSPWKQAAARNPGDDWQPQQWSPSPARRRG